MKKHNIFLFIISIIILLLGMSIAYCEIVVIEWDEVNTADYYTLYISDNTDINSEKTVLAENIIQTSYSYEVTLPLNKVYWLTASNSFGESGFSAPEEAFAPVMPSDINLKIYIQIPVSQ